MRAAHYAVVEQHLFATNLGRCRTTPARTAHGDCAYLIEVGVRLEPIGTEPGIATGNDPVEQVKRTTLGHRQKIRNTLRRRL
jgi:hypothetical protein